MRNDNENIERIRALYSTIRERVISPVTVRRTRKDLKNYPDYLKDLEDQGITFSSFNKLKEAFERVNENARQQKAEEYNNEKHKKVWLDKW